MARSSEVEMAVLALGMAGAAGALVMAQEGGEGFGSSGQQEMRIRNLQGKLMDQVVAAGGDWAILLPKLDRVLVLKSRLRAGGGDGLRGATDVEPGPPIPLAAASRELRRAVDNKDSSLDDVKAKLQKLRDEKAKLAAELAVARTDLKANVNIRVEAVLVLEGYLE